MSKNATYPAALVSNLVATKIPIDKKKRFQSVNKKPARIASIFDTLHSSSIAKFNKGTLNFIYLTFAQFCQIDHGLSVANANRRHQLLKISAKHREQIFYVHVRKQANRYLMKIFLNLIIQKWRLYHFILKYVYRTT